MKNFVLSILLSFFIEGNVMFYVGVLKTWFQFGKTGNADLCFVFSFHPLFVNKLNVMTFILVKYRRDNTVSVCRCITFNVSQV